jgi:hypothetical protein
MPTPVRTIPAEKATNLSPKQESRNPITNGKEYYHVSTQMQDYPHYNHYDMVYARGVNQKASLRELEGKVLPRAAYAQSVG